MGQLPPPARAIWATVAIIGSGVAAVSLATTVLAPIPWPEVIGVFLAGFLCQAWPVQFPYRRAHHAQSSALASAVHVASLLVLSPPLAVVINVASCLLCWVAPRRTWYKRAFNAAQYALAIGAAGWLWHTWGSGSGLIRGPADLLWLAVAVAVYFALNTGLVTLIVAAADGLPVRYVWLRSHRHLLPIYLGMLAAGVLTANLWSHAPWSLPLAILSLLSIYYALQRTIEFEQQTLSTLFDLANILDQRDYATHQHSLRVGEEAEKLALRLNLPAEEAYLIYLCGRLHDIGKCAVDNEVLLKPEPLTAEEREHMARHAAVGGQMLANFTLFKVGASYVRGHHEWYDGSGYPDGLCGDAIPLGARVIAVADAFDAMTTDRPYRLALSHEEAARRLREGRGTQWDPVVVDAYLDMLAERHQSGRRVPSVPGTRRAGSASDISAVSP